MKKALACIIVSFVLFACGNPTIPENGTVVTLKSVKTTGVRSLYTSKVTLSGGGQWLSVLSGTEIATLSYIADTGENTPIVFTTSDDRDVLLNVTKTRAAGDAWIIADFTALYTTDGSDQIYRSGRTLANMQTGTLYDFSAYEMDDILIDGNTVYARENTYGTIVLGGTLYKIALGSDMQAVPLNNAAFNRAEEIRFKLGTKGLSLNKKYFAESDEGAREHKQAKVRTLQFLKTNQYFSKTIHPRVSRFYYPSARLTLRTVLLFSSFLPAALDMRDESA